MYDDAIAPGYSPVELHEVGMSSDWSVKRAGVGRPWQGPVPPPRMSPPVTLGDAIGQARRSHSVRPVSRGNRVAVTSALLPVGDVATITSDLLSVGDATTIMSGLLQRQSIGDTTTITPGQNWKGSAVTGSGSSEVDLPYPFFSYRNRPSRKAYPGYARFFNTIGEQLE